MSQQNNSSEQNRSSRFNSNHVIIAGLIALAGYVALGYGPFGASAYDAKGAPIQVQQYGGSADFRFATF